MNCVNSDLEHSNCCYCFGMDFDSVALNVSNVSNVLSVLSVLSALSVLSVLNGLNASNCWHWPQLYVANCEPLARAYY